jgi:hypothetical protein
MMPADRSRFVEANADHSGGHMTTHVATQAAPRVERAQTDRIFYTGMALLIAVIVFAGFSPSFFMRPSSQPALSTLLTLHGVVFTSWIVVLIVQTSFIAARRRDLHKQAGIIAMCLGAGMVVLGVIAAIDALRRGAAPLPGIDPRTFLVVPLGDMVAFAFFLAAGFYFRRSTETHKRLMLLATMSLLPAAFGRIVALSGVSFLMRGGPFSIYGLVLVLVILGAAYDFATRRGVHPVYIWGGLAIAVSVPLRLVIGGSGPWLKFADSLMR